MLLKTETKNDLFVQVASKEAPDRMTEEYCIQLIDQMLEEIMAWVRYKAICYLKYSEVKVRSYKKNNLLPRILLSAALLETARIYRPSSDYRVSLVHRLANQKTLGRLKNESR